VSVPKSLILQRIRPKKGPNDAKCPTKEAKILVTRIDLHENDAKKIKKVPLKFQVEYLVTLADALDRGGLRTYNEIKLSNNEIKNRQSDVLYEKYIMLKYLDNKKIRYHREYKFDDCKNINLLKFDFYLPDYNLCIEYDGRQHFESMDIFGGDIEFEKRKKNDKIKNDFCKDSKIRMLRVSYFEKNIESLLDLFLITEK
jgi:very-short-patch-repair endonuclease